MSFSICQCCETLRHVADNENRILWLRGESREPDSMFGVRNEASGCRKIHAGYIEFIWNMVVSTALSRKHLEPFRSDRRSIRFCSVEMQTTFDKYVNLDCLLTQVHAVKSLDT